MSLGGLVFVGSSVELGSVEDELEQVVVVVELEDALLVRAHRVYAVLTGNIDGKTLEEEDFRGGFVLSGNEGRSSIDMR
jgi:hypothetical protein